MRTRPQRFGIPGSSVVQTFFALGFLISQLGMTAGPAAAATYYVDNTNVSCSDLTSNPGTSIGSPLCTLTRAVAKATLAGDTARVLAGTYAEVVKPNSGTAGSPVTFSAAPGVTVTGPAGNSTNGGAFRITSKSYIVVDGFTITGTADYGIILDTSNHITISNNHVSYSGTASIHRIGIYLRVATDSIIIGNTTDHNTMDGIRLAAASNSNTVSNNISFGNAEGTARNACGINVLTSNSNTILHNIVYANEDTGLNFYTGSTNNLVIGNVTYGNGDHGIDNNAAPSNVFIGNTVQGNVTVGINLEGAIAPGSGGATVINNIMVDNGFLLQVGGGTSLGSAGNIRVDAQSLVGTTLDYNVYHLNSGTAQIYWGGGSAYTSLVAFQTAQPTQEIHGLQGNPLLAAAAAPAQRPAAAPFNVAVNVGDYHITAGSPAVDSANADAPSEPTFDIVGYARVDDPGTANTGAGTRTYDDRGAYEFQPLLAACGDGAVTSGEQCDDGAANGTPASCCSFTCSFAPTGTACGSPTNDACDNPDTCNASGSCQVNNEPSTTVCRAAAGVCDVAENCDGAGACPANVLAPVTTVCRAAGECDVAENCTGAGTACPADVLAPSGTSCGNPDATVCNAADSCDATGACVDRKKTSGTVCLAGTGTCDPNDTCNGTTNICPAVLAAYLTACTADANVCTTDLCNGSGGCLAINNTASCSDGLFCNGVDTCANGGCTVHPGDPCTGGLECNNVCNETADSCQVLNGGACDDGLACTMADACTAGVCGGWPDPLCIDHYLCYSAARTPRTTPPTLAFTPRIVSLVDAIESSAAEVKKPVAICPPADKNGEGMLDPVTHEEAYSITSELKHARLSGVIVTDQFGTLSLNTVKADRLLVPTNKGLGAAPAGPPAPGAADHYKCYLVNVTVRTPRFPVGVQATVADQFENRIYNIKRPHRLCVPVDLNSEGIQSPAANLLCYTASAAIGQPRHTKVLGQIYTDNQFGTYRLNTSKEEELCVPAHVTLP